MKTGYSYSVLVSQVAIVELGYDEIDIYDLAVYSEIVTIMNLKSTQQIIVPNGVYYWISHQLILDRLPTLRIGSKSSIKRKINKLIERNMIDRLDQGGTQKSYYRLTDFHEKYTSFKNEPPRSDLNGGWSKSEWGSGPNLNHNDITKEDVTNKESNRELQKQVLPTSKILVYSSSDPKGLEVDIPRNYKKWSQGDFANSISSVYMAEAKKGKKLDSKLLKRFFEYWIEPDPKSVMRFQLQKTWSTSGRVLTWISREAKYSGVQENGFEKLMKKMEDDGLVQ